MMKLYHMITRSVGDLDLFIYCFPKLSDYRKRRNCLQTKLIFAELIFADYTQIRKNE